MTPKLCSQTRKAPASQQCLRQRPASTLSFHKLLSARSSPLVPTLPQKLMNNSAELSLVTKGASFEEACLLGKRDVNEERKQSLCPVSW